MFDWQIRDAVKDIKEKFGTKNVWELVDYLDIQLFKRPLGEGINDNLVSHTQRWVLAHEIGHAVLHDGKLCNFLCNQGSFEKEADLFAAELLLPDDLTEYDRCTNEYIASVESIPVELVNMKYRVS